MNKFVTLSLVACALISNTNSFGMLRALAQRTSPQHSSKFIRPITLRFPSEDFRKELIEASKKINNDCNHSLFHNKETLILLRNHLDLTERIKNLNTENLTILTSINSDGIYKLHDLQPHFYQLAEWERQLMAKE